MDTATVALKSLGNAIQTISDDSLTLEALRGLQVHKYSAHTLGTCLRRYAYGNELLAEDVATIKALRLSLLKRDDWDEAVEKVSLGATLAHTADAFFEARYQLASKAAGHAASTTLG